MSLRRARLMKRSCTPWRNTRQLLPSAGSNQTEASSETATRQCPLCAWREVRELAVKRNPKLDAAFGRQFIVRDGARPLGLGFCGRRIVANFSTLSRKQLAAAVRISKAKLWDLEHARDGASRGWFVGTPQRFELLLNAPDAASDGSGKGSIAEAFAELEFEADRRDIISRPLGTPKLIVEHLLKAEA